MHVITDFVKSIFAVSLDAKNTVGIKCCEVIEG